MILHTILELKSDNESKYLPRGKATDKAVKRTSGKQFTTVKLPICTSLHVGCIFISYIAQFADKASLVGFVYTTSLPGYPLIQVNLLVKYFSATL